MTVHGPARLEVRMSAASRLTATKYSQQTFIVEEQNFFQWRAVVW